MKIQQIQQAVARFIRDEEGLTIVEYAVAGGLIAAGVVVSFKTLGLTVKGVIDGINTALTTP